ncbi:MAG: aminoglycoside phosphotransferase family protein [Clostridia bacterium]|nr:aminoglycoside phosphotransferase family protein [Clostridia bacterium]
MDKDFEIIVRELADHFKIKGEIVSCEPYGNGHINSTFVLVCIDETGKRRRYILQKINKSVFKSPEEVMENIVRVTAFLKSNPASLKTLSVIFNKDNLSYYKTSEGDYWRIYKFVESSICLDLPETEEDFYQSAFAFGRFQRDLNEFPADTLHETIPDFHNTPKRYETFLKAVREDRCGRAASVADEIKFFTDRADFYSVLLDSCKLGLLPLRVSHNDTKINNSMLHEDTRTALCVIDLDTIMPGFSVTDFGDAIRFGASTAAEDEKDLSKVNLDMNMFKIYAKGFLDGCGGQLLDSEIMLLPEGAKMMTIECGMRFLTDYLEGDTYFRTHYEGHNLDRCHTQMKLVSDMEANWDEMKATVKEHCKNK